MENAMNGLRYVGTFFIGAIVALIAVFSLTIVLPDHADQISSFWLIGAIALGWLFVTRKRKNEQAKKAEVGETIAQNTTQPRAQEKSPAKLSEGSVPKKRFPTWARAAIAIGGSYIALYFMLTPSIAEDASRFLRQNIGPQYVVEEVNIPFNYLISDRMELTAIVRERQGSRRAAIPLQVSGNCIFGRCSVAVRNIDILAYR